MPQNQHKMRSKLACTALFLLGASSAFSQWVPLNSTTTNDLHDIDLLTEDIAVIVGDAGTILLTTDGGSMWSDINDGSITDAVYGVQIRSLDTILVSTLHPSMVGGDIFRTVNGGSSWEPVYSADNTIHRIDLESNASNDLYAAATHLLRTPAPYGAVWDSLVPNISGTTSLDQIAFAGDHIGHLSGNISGFISYSAYFYRTENGTDWYPGDVFSFPNADAFTTMCFADPDTAMIFTNTYQGFMPSTNNHLIKIYDFNVTVPFPGDTIYAFSSQVVNDTMPAYMNDAVFLNGQMGFAFGDDGNIHATTNGGVDWSVTYTAGSPLFKVEFTNSTGYAVGADGVLVKYTDGSTTLVENGNDPFVWELMPNPTSDRVRIRSAAPLKSVSVRGTKGELVWSGTATGRELVIDLGTFANGAYQVEMTDMEGNVHSRKLMKVGNH